MTATGFTAAQYLNTMVVTGSDGRNLHDEWTQRGGAFAFLGMAMPGFPNFYMLYGPNTNGGAPITYYHERQADYVVSNLRRMVRQDITALDVKPLYVDMYNVWLQHRMKGTAWMEANNYFRDPSGKVVTQWPDGMVKYVTLLRLLRRPATAALESRKDLFEPSHQKETAS
ncbi:hypothetical protein [Aeromicrobium sp. UC242_57]|uniref:hypothetical protein n=1 Tax=Aeromicrobium sp. UC242_57 TaxID=3374624 RepID=UPI0037BF53F8